MKEEHSIPKPPWLRVRLPHGKTFARLREMMRQKSLHTVCEEAMCPNMAECWGCGTATFLILGDTCTRDCRFCAVKTGNPRGGVDMVEAGHVADAVASMGLKHAVITSVTRDDLDDGGAGLFAETTRRIHKLARGCTVEVLIPDLKGDRASLELVVRTNPEILGHNVETVPRLYAAVRPQAVYRRSLDVLRIARELDSGMLTKSGIMLGLGETLEEVLQVAADLRRVGCDIFTLGQYLRPTRMHLPVDRYYTPEEFEAIRKTCLAMGFRSVEAGPLVRSSYHAETQARAASSDSAMQH